MANPWPDFFNKLGWPFGDASRGALLVGSEGRKIFIQFSLGQEQVVLDGWHRGQIIAVSWVWGDQVLVVTITSGQLSFTV